MPRFPVGQRQFTDSILAILEVDGSAVTTYFSSAGLVKGQFIATVKKGSSSDSNLVTVKFNFPFGLVPAFLFQPKTLDCECREEGSSTLTQVTIRTLKSTDLTAKVDDADFLIFVFGTETIREGKY